MKLSDKIEYLQDHYMSNWIATRQECEDELSKSQSMFCLCGRLATGFHERNCRRFQNKVTAMTVKRLSRLIKKGE